MKKFDQALQIYLEDSEQLVKIRLKVDPKNRSVVDYKDFDGYEGYILKEGEHYEVLFKEQSLPVLKVPFSIVQVTEIPDQCAFDTIKLAAIKVLEEKGKLTDSIACKISACTEVEFLEQYLREEGLSDSEIKDIYKSHLFENIISERVNWGKIGKGLALGAGAAAATAIAPGLVADELAKFAKNKIKNSSMAVKYRDFIEGNPNDKQSAYGRLHKALIKARHWAEDVEKYGKNVFVYNGDWPDQKGGVVTIQQGKNKEYLDAQYADNKGLTYGNRSVLFNNRLHSFDDSLIQDILQDKKLFPADVDKPKNTDENGIPIDGIDGVSNTQ